MKLDRLIKVLIWAYLILLIFEGSLRKWVFPGLTGPLLVVRDPVVVAIYMAAVANGSFPGTKAMMTIGAMAAASAVFAMIFGHGDLAVMLFGLHANYLHLPLIWIMGTTLKRRDLLWVGLFFMVVAIPNTMVMIKQYNAAPTDWINYGAGGEGTEQITGAGSHIRPPGFFSFITGPMAFYPLVAGFIVYSLLGKQFLVRLIAIGSGIAVALAIPVSISRSVFLSVAIVGVTGVICAVISGKIAGNILKIGLLVAALVVIVPSVGVFGDALGSFKDRWELSTGDVKTDIGWRWASAYLEVFDFADSAPFFGYGVGMGTNAANALTGGQRNYSPAESEWGRIVGELGPILGFIYIGFRCWLTAHLISRALKAWSKHSDSLAILIASGVGFNVLNAQWGPPTNLGFSIFGAGLILAAANSAGTESPPEIKPEAPPETEIKKMPAHTGQRPPAISKPLRR